MKILILLLILPFMVYGQEARTNYLNYSARGTLEAHVGQEIGVNESYATLGATVTKRQWEGGFFDFKWHRFEHGSNAASIGFGTNSDWSSQEWIGFFYDWRHFRDQDFQQIGIQAEIDRCCWHLSFQGNLSLTNRKTICTFFEEFPGGFFFSKKSTEYACNLALLELSREFIIPSKWGDLSSRIGLGGYYITNDIPERDFGFIGTFEMEWNDYWWVKAKYSHDPIFENRFQISIGIYFPIVEESSCCDCCCRNPILPRRTGIIPLRHKSCCRFNWDDSLR